MDWFAKNFPKRKHVSRLTQQLVILATFVDSFLAGMNVNRALVEMPAWQQVGPRSWAAFSRRADLGLGGLILYPSQAFLGAFLSLAALISFFRDGGEPRRARAPLYLAAVSTIAGLLATTRAAPVMLGVRDKEDESIELQQALDRFQSWGNLRGVFQVLAFAANLWSLVAIMDSRRKVRL